MVFASRGLFGLLGSLFVLGTAVSPLLVVGGLEMVALLVLGLWVVLGGVRWGFGDARLRTDCLVFGGFGLLARRQELWQWGKEIIWSGVGDVWNGRSVYAAGSLALAGAVAVSTMWIVLRKKHEPQNEKEDIAKFDVKHPGTLIFPCRTTHARVFPKRHAFSYSYLLYGIPITPAGTRSDGTDVADGSDGRRGNWWLQVRAEDYLMRGYGGLGFYGKLRLFMRDQGVLDSEWSYAYLVTAPRFFGYSFNPVSFWYIYDRFNRLQRMILEVNNTFGERRMYLLDGACPPTPPKTPDHERPETDTKKPRFTDKWQKDFHVSPFNSRKGSYSLKALDPFLDPQFTEPNIDNTITLSSSKDHAKIVARVHSTGTALVANNLGVWGSLSFIGGWWWVGLVTSPRILREAFKLFYKRSLHVWFRPEVLSPSIGRTPTADEVGLQKIFHDYLEYLVQRSAEPLHITFYTAIPDRPKDMIASTYIPGRNIATKKLEIRVLTPAFYSRFVHYAQTSETLDRECLFTDEKNRTLWISNPELLHLLLTNARPKISKDDEAWYLRSRLDELRWAALKKLRCPPAEPPCPGTPTSSDFRTDNVRALPFSDLDTYVRSRHGHLCAGSYRRTVTKIFLAQRYFFGFTQVIDLLDILIRILLCYYGVKALVYWANEAGVHGLYRQPQAMNGPNVVHLQGARPEWPFLLGLGVKVSACHLWELAKGYA